MQDLLLSISDGTIQGSGVDMISTFTLSGTIHADGVVEIVKQYDGRHHVLYVGNYDGEGTLFGRWDIDGFRGEWVISLERDANSTAQAIEELIPLTDG